ncbi:alpha/beta hydrolase fold domain-containing protein [Novosphingobium album (ex Liu et al. 2023)]|uniref:Alpha/beta hydrolase fold domain-containing protein n=1 Tax=Novosphingobium album (ex Liu et al. 2023) TaxID=3031130 RepID=A0ABT5WPN5_9SPHN|nr:alpha/beta hydrolase fold domain-containing protein [Novosphingobium album (ex Liu et al. 2023)]MDE8651990.1 alpha/beta hydrolase fold domain-containing protein [Novosphingobium album (ex Liu et al. 2023)]
MGVGNITGTATEGGVHVPARTIPAPSTVSVEAQAFLSSPPMMGEGHPSDLNDKEAWRACLEAADAMLSAAMAVNVERFPAQIITHQVGAVPVYEVVPQGMAPDTADRAIFYLHGGAYVHGSGLAAAHMALPLTTMAQVRAFSIDYRMPPDHPFPTGLDDTVEAYRWLLERFDARNVVVVGGSAGGGLAASFMLKARDLGLPLAGACVLATPEADLTESGDTFETNDTIDVVLKHRLTQTIALYANGHDLRDPYLSAVFGDFGKGFPPTMLVSGTRDLFLSNTVILHRALLRAGCEAELHVWEAMPHGGFFGAPEDGEVLLAEADFIRRKLRIG